MTVLPLTTAHTNLKALTTATERYIFDDHSAEETGQLAKDIIESMYHYKGLGISANQLGLSWSVFAMRGDPEDYICFNPFIAMPSDEHIKLDEGCLSFPGLTFKITRPRHIRFRFADINGTVDTFQFANLTARIIQHEMDHLAGKIFFEGTPRPTLERMIRQARNKGIDYSATGLMKYAGKKG